MSRVTRSALIVLGGLVGAVLFVVTASAALIIFFALAALAALAFAVFWIRAKIKGQTVRQAAFDKMASQIGVDPEQMRAAQSREINPEGEVLDAHRTADGWSVDQ